LREAACLTGNDSLQTTDRKNPAAGTRPEIAGSIQMELDVMKNLVRKCAPAVAAVGMLMIASAAAQAQCVTKGSYGTAGSVDSAKFQAWEAILQATSWGSWAQFMGGGMVIGTAPGYKVSGVKFSCKPGGAGQECTARATLCSK
jgi:hypothetical protein